MGVPTIEGADPVAEKRDYLKELAEMPTETTHLSRQVVLLVKAVLQLKEELANLKSSGAE